MDFESMSIWNPYNQPKAHPNPQTESTAHTFEIAI